MQPILSIIVFMVFAPFVCLLSIGEY